MIFLLDIIIKIQHNKIDGLDSLYHYINIISQKYNKKMIESNVKKRYGIITQYS